MEIIYILFTWFFMLSTIPDKNRRTLRGNMDDQKSDILRS